MRKAAGGATQAELKAAGISRQQSRARAAAGLPAVGKGWAQMERDLHKQFELILRQICSGANYLSILPAVPDAIKSSPTDIGTVLREGGRVVYDPYAVRSRFGCLLGSFCV